MTILVLLSIAVYELTLHQCINLAKESNLELQEAKVNIEVANIRLKETYSRYSPSLDISGGYRISEDENCQYSWGISGQYVIFQGGMRVWNSKILKLQLEDAQELYRQIENQIVFQVRQSFYKIIKLQNEEKLLSDILNRRRENLVLIELNYKSGRESAPNYELAKINLKQVEYEIQKLKADLESAKYTLATLLNIDNTNFVLKYEPLKEEIPNLDSIISVALKRHPELLRENIAEEIYQIQLKMKYANYFPSFNVNASYGKSGQTLLSTKGAWTAGISLGLTLFDGLSRENQIAEAKLMLKTQSYKKERVKVNIINGVREAYNTYNNAL
ncbi:MAG: TolC family protein, partial [candidate division WOR-3 bacterium]|nr:TolC family protein [candidate division WOR-3 bacterium]